MSIRAMLDSRSSSKRDGLRERIARLAEEYDALARDDASSQECMASDLYGEFSDALDEVLKGTL